LSVLSRQLCHRIIGLDWVALTSWLVIHYVPD
jgi:hypothetical protein